MNNYSETVKHIKDEQERQLNESAVYDDTIKRLMEAKEQGVPLEEGLFSSILGGAAGMTFGPAVMKAVCDALGVDVKGTFGSLLTSRIILTAVGAKIGWSV